jgi:hypothetical protein
MPRRFPYAKRLGVCHPAPARLSRCCTSATQPARLPHSLHVCQAVPTSAELLQSLHTTYRCMSGMLAERPSSWLHVCHSGCTRDTPVAFMIPRRPHVCLVGCTSATMVACLPRRLQVCHGGCTIMCTYTMQAGCSFTGCTLATLGARLTHWLHVCHARCTCV